MRGFTLPDLLLVSGLIGVLLFVGLPGLRALHANIAVTVEHQRLLSLLRLARARAVERRQETVLCPLVAPAAAASCGAADGSGWLLFIDGDGDNAFHAGDDQLLRLEQLSRRHGLRIVDRHGDAYEHTLRYRPDGSVARPTTIGLCAEGARRLRRVVVSMTGRARSTEEAGACPS